MDTMQLECFVQVAQNLNFRRAAQEMHLSQPTVSKYIASLESELGGALFNRNTRSVELTELGVSFMDDAQEILRITYASQRRAASIASGAGLRIAYSDPNELPLVSKTIRALKKDDRDFSVSLELGSRDVNLQLLERGQVDLVMGFASEDVRSGGIVFEKIVDDSLVCVARSGTGLSKLEVVGSEDVRGVDQVVCLPASLRRRGYRAQSSIPDDPSSKAVWCSTTSEALCLVDAGFGYALLPRMLAGGDCGTRVVLPWEGSPSSPYGAYLLASGRNGETNRFLSAAKAAALSR
ncbi:LysR family transcriptional regulator [Collinsella aerofaciens]|uniref:LysR family transcriptional regulator n=1 Tax=Collinsella aerofaciens TaxID=74426 RepID=UPI003D7B17C4